MNLISTIFLSYSRLEEFFTFIMFLFQIGTISVGSDVACNDLGSSSRVGSYVGRCCEEGEGHVQDELVAAGDSDAKSLPVRASVSTPSLVS